MLCRVAEDVFWMSRYVERATTVARLIDVTGHLELDAGVDDRDLGFWRPLLGPDTPADGGDVGTGAREIRHYLAFDPKNPNALVSCIQRARSAAQRVREAISSEMWEQINGLYHALREPTVLAEAAEEPHTFCRRMLMGVQLVHGLADSTLAHDEVWQFVCLGKYLERADCTARVMRLQAHLLTQPAGRRDDVVRWLAVLRSCGSAEAYARYYSLRVEPARVIEFLLLNPVFPHSVRFSVTAAWLALRAIAGPEAVAMSGSHPALRTLGRLEARLHHAAVDEVLESGLPEFLADVQREIASTADHVTESYLSEEPRPDRLVSVARAAMIMAAQQQQ